VAVFGWRTRFRVQTIRECGGRVRRESAEGEQLPVGVAAILFFAWLHFLPLFNLVKLLVFVAQPQTLEPLSPGSPLVCSVCSFLSFILLFFLTPTCFALLLYR
jgi:hypothetical protein